MTTTSIALWTAGQDRTYRLADAEGPIAIVWPDGNRWRVSGTHDTGPGELHPTLDEAQAAAMIIARNRLGFCDCPAVHQRVDTDGRCFTCSGTIDRVRETIRRHRLGKGDKPSAARHEAEELAAKLCGVGEADV